MQRAARDRRREREPVGAGRHPERRVGGLRIVGVHEVEVHRVIGIATNTSMLLYRTLVTYLIMTAEGGLPDVV